MKGIRKNLLELGQDHLLQFYNDLSNEEKMNLEKQIETIDFDLINNLYKNSYIDEKIDMTKISPLFLIDQVNLKEQENYQNLGENLVKNGHYAIVLLAGGNSSRLGYNQPKGCLKILYDHRKISLYEIYFQQFYKIYERYGQWLHIYIMTSVDNNIATQNFFEQNNFFGYPKNHVHFFVQGFLPIINIEGKIQMQSKSSVLFGPNGNGNVFQALKNSDLITHMQKNNIEYILFSTIDNVVANLVDFVFLGATISKGYELASKTLFKENPESKSWIFCKYNNRPFMLPSEYIDRNLSEQKNEHGQYLYRETNITYHLVSLSLVKKFSNHNLKYHRAFKKYDYLDVSGNMIRPEKCNSFKFEQFIFDAFYYGKDMLLYRCKPEEFCPIKVVEDIKKAEKQLEDNNRLKSSFN